MIRSPLNAEVGMRNAENVFCISRYVVRVARCVLRGARFEFRNVIGSNRPRPRPRNLKRYNGVEDEDEYEDEYEPKDELNQHPATLL